MKPLTALVTVGSCLISTVWLRSAPGADGGKTPLRVEGERCIAADNVCAWPCVCLLKEGDLAAVIYDTPSHGSRYGGIDLYASSDGGKTWTKRSTVGKLPGRQCVNHAAGVLDDGTLVVAHAVVDSEKWQVKPAEQWLMPRVVRSTDGGRTWDAEASVALPDDLHWAIPFGKIVQLADGTLLMSVYVIDYQTKAHSCYVVRSTDRGRTWGDGSLLARDCYNETSILALSDGRLLAAARTSKWGARIDLFESADGGRSWAARGPVTGASQHPGDLLQLENGHVLLTFGNRIAGEYGVRGLLSLDGGRTWDRGTEFVLERDALNGDCGYPSSTQLADGTIVTLYYAKGTKSHKPYHAAAVRYRESDILATR
jgi:hypothetical protein